MADRQYFTVAQAARATTADTTPRVYLTLGTPANPFQPDASSTYLFLLDIWVDVSTRNVTGNVDVLDGATVRVPQAWHPDGAEEGVAVRPLHHAFVVSYGASPGAQSLQVRFYLSRTIGTMGVRQGRLTALKLGANDLSATLSAVSPSVAHAAGWVSRQTKTLAAGEYLLIASASVATLSGSASGADIRASVGAGPTTFGDCSPFRTRTPETGKYVGWRAVADYTASAGDVFSVDYGAESGCTAGVRDVTLVALKVADLPALYKAEQAAEINTASTSPQTANTLSFTAVAADHLLIEAAFPRATSTSTPLLSEEVAFTKGGTAYDQLTLHPEGSGDPSDYGPIGRAMVETLPAGAVSYVTTYRSGGSGLTAYVKGRRLYAIQLTASRGSYLGAGAESGVAPGVAGDAGMVVTSAGAEVAVAPAVSGDGALVLVSGGSVGGVAPAVAGDASLLRVSSGAVTGVAPAVSGDATVAAAAASGRGVQAIWADQATRVRGARPILLIKADFGAAGVVYLWTGYGDLVWDSITWHGGGDLLTVGDPKETTTRERNGVTVRLASRDQFQIRDHLQEALSADIHGNKARIHLGWLLDDGSLAGDPMPEFDGELSSIQIAGQDDGSLYIDVTADHETRDLDRGQRNRITAASQAAIDPTDKGLEYLADVANIKIEWGTDYYNRQP